MELISNIIQTTLNSFDFAFCVVVNVLTYLIIKKFDSIKKTVLTTWQKRLCLIVSIIVIAVVYYLLGSDSKLIINSAILAPVSWSWIFKPLCSKFNLDYKKFDILE